MVFTALQITAFFEDNAQMGLSNRTRLYLQSEGITHPSDLIDFVKKDDWSQLIENCKRPPQMAGAGGAMVAQQPFQLPAKSLLRLRVASKVVEYYSRTGRALSSSNMTWVRLNNFQVEWDTLVERKKANDEHNLPVISSKLSITAWFEAYETFAEEFIGQALCPIAWIYREIVAVDGNAPALEADQPYSTEHGSVANELVHRLSHTHPFYRIDNATGFSHLTTATLGTQYASTIAPFKRRKDGHGALLALMAQFAGPAHWDKEVRLMNDFLMNALWTGTTAFTLHGFLAKHRASFNTLQRCAEHVRVELPNERTRVGYLLENINTQDRDVATALSHVRLDDGPTGMREDFERSVAFLLPTDPVRKKRGGKRGAAQISAVGASNTGNPGKGKGRGGGKKVGFKSTYGKTGVELRYYKAAEFSKLTQEQKDELIAHRKSNGHYKGAWTGKSKGGQSDVGSTTVNKATIAAMIREHADKKQKEDEEQDAMRAAFVDELKGVIRSEVASSAAAQSAVPKRALQRAGAGAQVASAEAEGTDALAERCAASLMEKFNSMGTKAKGKSG